MTAIAKHRTTRPTAVMSAPRNEQERGRRIAAEPAAPFVRSPTALAIAASPLPAILIVWRRVLLADFVWGRFALAALAGLLTGVAKTGIPGFGILAVPLMVLAVGDARHSAGWLLPLLCLADLFAIATYRRHADARRLFNLLPWVLGGIALGAATLAAPERLLRLLVAAIVIVMIALRWLRGRGAADAAAGPANAPADRWWQAAGYGVSAGFATTVANAAGPVMNLYLLARRLPKHEFVATGAWFFFVVNLVKLPIYGFHGLIDRRSLAFDLALAPSVVAGALLGRLVLRRMPQAIFDRLVMVLTVGAAALLLAPR